VVYRYFAAILRAAVEDRIIAVSPCRGIRLPKIEKIRVEQLETDEVVALADAVDDRYRALVVLAAGTGMRQGEVFGLTLPRLDLLRRGVKVQQQLITIQGRVPYLGPPKTEASLRTIPLPLIVVDSVAAHLAEYEPGDLRTVFSGDRGEPLRRNRFSERVWRPAVARAGLRPGDALSRPSALLRQPSDPTWGIGEDGASPTGARQRHRDSRYLRPSLARF
jgi:integrase